MTLSQGLITVFYKLTLMLDRLCIKGYIMSMNKLSTPQRASILRCLVEGNSIRSTVRITGASKNTIAKPLVFPINNGLWKTW